MSYNIWISNFARLAADEVAAGQQGFQKILRERFLSACVNNTDVSIRQFTLPSTIAETTPKLTDGDNEKDGGDNEKDGGDNENTDNESDGGNNQNSDNENDSGEDSESSQQSEDEEDEDSEAEAVIRKEAYDRLLRAQRKS